MVTHENDRAWRTAVVMNKPSLLALRYQRTEDSYIYPYKLIRLTSKFIKFRVVKVYVIDKLHTAEVITHTRGGCANRH